MDANNSLNLESVKDELRLLTKSDQFYSRIKSAVLPETIGYSIIRLDRNVSVIIQFQS